VIVSGYMKTARDVSLVPGSLAFLRFGCVVKYHNSEVCSVVAFSRIEGTFMSV